MAQLQNCSDEPIQKSSLWQTTPVDCPPDSPKFVNAIVGLIPRTAETPILIRTFRKLASSRAVYVALLGSSRGVVNADAIARKISCKLVTVCEASWQLLPDSLWL